MSLNDLTRLAIPALATYQRTLRAKDYLSYA
jgi:hypothetical protein